MNLDGARRRAREATERAEKATEGPWMADLDLFDSEAPEIEACITTKKISMSLLFRSATGIMVRENADWYRAQESQVLEDAKFIAHARADVPELASLVGTLAGEVEQLRGLLHVTENNANEHANDSFVLQRQVDRLRKENEVLRGEARRLRGELDAANREVAFGVWGGYGGTEGESDLRGRE